MPRPAHGVAGGGVNKTHPRLGGRPAQRSTRALSAGAACARDPRLRPAVRTRRKGRGPAKVAEGASRPPPPPRAGTRWRVAVGEEEAKLLPAGLALSEAAAFRNTEAPLRCLPPAAPFAPQARRLKGGRSRCFWLTPKNCGLQLCFLRKRVKPLMQLPSS